MEFLNNLHNIENEKDYIGAIVFDNDLLDLCTVQAKHFYNTDNQKAFEGILELKERGEEIDYFTLAHNTSKQCKYKASDFMTMSENGLEKRHRFSAMQKEIIRLYNKRTTKKLLQNGLENLIKGEDPQTILSDIKKNTDETTKDDIKVKSLSNSLEKALNIIEDGYANDGKLTGMLTGYNKLDRILNGINKKDYYILGARPGKGKTGFSIELASRLGIKNKVLFFSLEMPEEQIAMRLISNQSKLPMLNVKTGNLQEKSFLDLTNVINKICTNKNIKIVDNKNTTIEDIRTIATMEKNKNGLDVVIVDYLTLCNTREKFKDLREQTNYISKQLRLLTDLDIAVISLAQLNRGVESRADKTPMLSDLRETGNIEQDANVILFLSDLQQEQGNKQNKFKPQIVNVTVAKNRNGESGGIIQFNYYKNTQIFEEI